MFQDNPLLAQLKAQIQETLPKKEGTVKATDKKFGFLEIDSKKSVFIPPPFMKKVMHGDKVSAIIRSDNGKDSAEPETLIEQAVTRFIGRIRRFKGRLNVVPDHPQLKKLTLKAKTVKGLPADELKEGDWVVAHLTQHPLAGDDGFFAEISEKITDADDKIAPWWVTLAQNDLPNREPDGIADDAWQLNDSESLQRTDLTDVHFVTIDGESTKDMDDALFAKPLDNGQLELSVAIADPTAYISPDSEMDKVARERGFTIYLPGRNIPMLPRFLADNLCSLIENEVRPAIVAVMVINQDGSISDNVTFKAALVKSHARLNYNQVSNWLEQGTESEWQPDGTTKDVIESLHKVAQLRSAWREKHAVVFPDRPDYRFELSENNDVIAIHADERRIANKLVEETMIAANICAGRLLREKLEIGVFNTHHGIKSEKIKAAIEMLNEAGAPNVTEESLLTLEGFSAVRRWLNQQPTAYLDNRMRKLQGYGETSIEAGPHFAMGLDVYATWTSPIRKYGDMINHRLLKAAITGDAPVQKPDASIGDELGLHKKHHKIAERNIADWLYVRTLADDAKNEAEYEAEIFDISRAGLRARIGVNGAAVFIPLSSVCSNRERIVGNHELGMVLLDGKVHYRLADAIDIVITSVNQETRNIVAKPKHVLAEPS
ncbi:exoribonuclease II [Vibrio ulleungensis]|uniref:Exoribonuclease 2 n=1 Tax=Vibrio ulleungensis TaxID=2807619 RepID=A0ABS2HHI7_9VIBR|nr:exoribonuclease II [Vibrio ulleungensis]MBM7035633.1 exoribonuclease II [Vibrio ulleungensis]